MTNFIDESLLPSIITSAGSGYPGTRDYGWPRRPGYGHWRPSRCAHFDNYPLSFEDDALFDEYWVELVRGGIHSEETIRDSWTKSIPAEWVIAFHKRDNQRVQLRRMGCAS